MGSGPEPSPPGDGLVPLEELAARRGADADEVHALVRRRLLPGPSAVDADGRELYAPDLLRLADEAGGVAELRRHFEGRYALAADAQGTLAGPDELDRAWDDYLDGSWGAVLREVTPEAAIARRALSESVRWLLDHPEPESWRWADRLRARVDALESLERPAAVSPADGVAARARREHPAVFSSGDPGG